MQPPQIASAITGSAVLRSMATVLALISGLTSACQRIDVPAQLPVRLIIGTGPEHSPSNVIGGALAAAYSRQLTGVQTTIRQSAGVDETFQDLEAGRADVVFVDSETAYVGYRGGAPASGITRVGVRAIAVLFPTAVHVFMRRELGIHSIGQLKGRRVAVGARDGYADQAFQQILASYSLSYRTVQPVFGLKDEITIAFRAGRLDGIVFYAPLLSRSIATVTQQVDLDLVSIERDKIGAIQGTSERSHFLKSMTIPKRTYSNQEQGVLTVGEDFLLLCRDDLADDLVYNLTKVLFDSVEELARAHPSGRSIHVERGPTASVPLHGGAARFYREHELPK